MGRFESYIKRDSALWCYSNRCCWKHMWFFDGNLDRPNHNGSIEVEYLTILFYVSKIFRENNLQYFSTLVTLLKSWFDGNFWTWSPFNVIFTIYTLCTILRNIENELGAAKQAYLSSHFHWKMQSYFYSAQLLRTHLLANKDHEEGMNFDDNTAYY